MVIVCILSISAISATSEITSNKQITSTDNNVENNIETNICYDDVFNKQYDDELILEENNGRDEESGYRTDKTTESNDDPLTFTKLNKTINDNTNSTIYLSNNYKYDNKTDIWLINGIIIGRDLTIYGNGVTIDGDGSARIFRVENNINVKFYNINFKNGKANVYGGAIYQGNAYNCTFTNNKVEYDRAKTYGGAIYNGNAYNCTFTNNKALNGGAISNGNAYNCTFIKNIGRYGGAIYEGNATNCTFIGNTAGGMGGAIYGGSAYNCNFTGNNAYSGGAISGLWDEYNVYAYNCTFTNNTAIYGGAINNGNAYNCTFTENKAEEFGGAMCIGNATNCTLIKNNANLGIAIYEGNAIKSIFICYYAPVSELVYKGTAEDCIFEYIKLASKITANPVSTIYNVGKYLVITLKDEKDKPISDAILTVNLGSAKKYTTDANGQVKINVANLVPKTYTAKITYAGSDGYNGTTGLAKVTVKKAKPKITAKSSIYKLKVKTKKYTATFKTNKNQALKNTKVTLKVYGKTYSVKTNNKGQGVFKITNLRKIGSYIAVITVPTNNYYNKVSKNVKITVKQ